MNPRAGSHEVATARKAAALGQRLDGRKMDEYPAIECTLGDIAQTSGSAQLRLGSAHVLVGIKVSSSVTGSALSHPASGTRFTLFIRCTWQPVYVMKRWRMCLGQDRLPQAHIQRLSSALQHCGLGAKRLHACKGSSQAGGNRTRRALHSGSAGVLYESTHAPPGALSDARTQECIGYAGGGGGTVTTAARRRASSARSPGFPLRSTRQ